jgi:hypothetical protein
MRFVLEAVPGARAAANEDVAGAELDAAVVLAVGLGNADAQRVVFDRNDDEPLAVELVPGGLDAHLSRQVPA